MRVRLLLALLVAPILLACVQRDDGFLLLRRREMRLDNERTQLAYAQPDDATALHVRRLLSDGFGAELLRTYAMARRFAGRGSEPAIIALGSEDAFAGVPYRGRQFDGPWFKEVLPPSTLIAWVDDASPTPEMAQLASGLAGAIVDTVTGTEPRASNPLREGYATFLSVVAGEWNSAYGPDERDELRRLPAFAEVRSNRAVYGAGRHGELLRSGREQVRDPRVVATVLHAMASSQLGRRMAPETMYRPFLESAPPHDIHPALLLGAFRNFQAKLFAAWRGAVASGQPPGDLVDLVEAYMNAFPAERAEATRILLVTTRGATALAHVDETIPTIGLERLTAEVLFGTRGLRDGLRRLPHD